MSNISFTQVTDGSAIDASDVNGPLNTIYDDYNGSIDSNNLADNAVTTAKITDANVTPAKWTNPYCARAYLSSAQDNLTNDTATKVLLDAESYDVGSNFDVANKRYVAPVTGYYKVFGKVTFKSTIPDKVYLAYIYVNGAAVSTTHNIIGTLDSYHACVMADIVYAEAGQYIELYAKHIGGANTVDLVNSAAFTHITISLEHQVV